MSTTHRQAVLLILLATALWGFSFPAVAYALGYFDTTALMFLRSLLAMLALGAYLVWKKSKLTANDWRAGILVGIVLFLAYGAQTYGQNFVTPSTSAFITALYVLFVPIFSALFLAQLPARRLLFASALALFGLFLLTGAHLNLGIGEAATLACALLFSGHILLTSKFKATDSVKLVFVQMAVGTVLAGAAMVLLGHVPASFEPLPMLALVYLGVFSAAIAYWAQSRAQQTLQATEAAVLFLSEPLFAGLFSVLFFGELLNVLKVAGAGLILLGLYIAERK